MRRLGRVGTGVALSLTLSLAAPPARPAIGSPNLEATATAGGTVEVPVSFAVVDTNTSKASCVSDWAPYVVHGHLTGPASLMLTRRASAVTVYLFGFDAGEWNWNFKAVPGYDYAAEMARAGHVSLTLDEVGYGASGRPPDGNLTCVGAEADMTHQIIQQLRSGRYGLGAGPGIAFSRVDLAGHDVGAVVAEVEAASYGDIDGLIEMSFADQGDTPFIVQRVFTASAQWCTTSPLESEPGQPTSYVRFATEEDWHTWLFYDANPAVIEATDALRNPNPCGVIRSTAQAVLEDNPYGLKAAVPGLDPGNSPVSPLASITAPVLVVFGDNDTQILTRQGQEEQQGNFPNSKDKTTVFIPNAGHFPMFERSAPQFREVVGSWLRSHGA